MPHRLSEVDDIIRGIPVVVGYWSTRYWGQVSSTRDAARDARTTTAKIVPRCSSRSAVRLGLFNARLLTDPRSLDLLIT